MTNIIIGDRVHVLNGKYAGKEGIVIDWIDTGSGAVYLVHLLYSDKHCIFTKYKLEVSYS